MKVHGLQGDQTSQFLKEINSEYSLEGLLMKLELQYFGHLTQRMDSLEKILKLGKIEGKGRRGWNRMRWLNSSTNRKERNLSKLQETMKGRGAWSAAVHKVTKNWEQLRDWTTKCDLPGRALVLALVSRWDLSRLLSSSLNFLFLILKK